MVFPRQERRPWRAPVCNPPPAHPTCLPDGTLIPTDASPRYRSLTTVVLALGNMRMCPRWRNTRSLKMPMIRGKVQGTWGWVRVWGGQKECVQVGGGGGAVRGAEMIETLQEVWAVRADRHGQVGEWKR